METKEIMNYYYVCPKWQNEVLCIVYASVKGLKRAKKEFTSCIFQPCPYTDSDKNIPLNIYN